MASSPHIEPRSELAALMEPRLNRYMLQTPHDTQWAFLVAPQKELLFGGAVGGGKSSSLLMAALQYFDVPGYSALILRTTLPALELAGGLIPRSHVWLDGTGATWNERKRTWTSPEGATLTFGYLEGPRDVFRYLSSEFQFIGFEELTEFRREEDYRQLFGRLRKPQEGLLGQVPLRMRATPNPVGPGYAWVKARFVDTPPSTSRAYLPSRLEDNPSIAQEEYEQMLDELPPILRAKLRHGDWTAAKKGELFKRELLRMVEPQDVGQLTHEVRFWDLAATEPSAENPDPDWTVGVRLGLDQDRRVWIRDIRMARCGPDDVLSLVRRTAEEDGRFIPVRMFKDPGQAGKGQISSYVKELAGFDVDGVPIHTDKLTAALPFAAQVGHHRVHVVSGPQVAAALDQVEDFPYASHDDVVDAISGGFNYLTGSPPKLKFKPTPMVR